MKHRAALCWGAGLWSHLDSSPSAVRGTPLTAAASPASGPGTLPFTAHGLSVGELILHVALLIGLRISLGEKTLQPTHRAQHSFCFSSSQGLLSVSSREGGKV